MNLEDDILLNEPHGPLKLRGRASTIGTSEATICPAPGELAESIHRKRKRRDRQMTFDLPPVPDRRKVWLLNIRPDAAIHCETYDEALSFFQGLLGGELPDGALIRSRKVLPLGAKDTTWED